MMVSYAVPGAETKGGREQPYREAGKSFLEVEPEQHREPAV